MASSITGIKFTFRDPDTDLPLSFGKVYTYDGGTTNPKETYVDEDKVVLNTNPVILDAYGQANIALEGRYRIVVHSADDVLMDVIDPISDAATQAKDFVGGLEGFGTAALYDAGSSAGELLIIGTGGPFGTAGIFPPTSSPSDTLNDMEMKYQVFYGANDVGNAPTTNPISIEMIPNADGTALQRVTDLVTNIQYQRVFNGTSWLAWSGTADVSALI